MSMQDLIRGLQSLPSYTTKSFGDVPGSRILAYPNRLITYLPAKKGHYVHHVLITLYSGI